MTAAHTRPRRRRSRRFRRGRQRTAASTPTRSESNGAIEPARAASRRPWQFAPAANVRGASASRGSSPDVEAALTAKRSTFARRHVMEELAGAHRRGASVDEIEALADRFLVRSRVVELGAARPANARAYAPSEPIYTTREVLALEDRLVRRAEAHARSRMATADRRAIEAALRRDPALGADQRELVRSPRQRGAGHPLRPRPRRRRQDASLASTSRGL